MTGPTPDILETPPLTPPEAEPDYKLTVFGIIEWIRGGGDIGRLFTETEMANEMIGSILNQLETQEGIRLKEKTAAGSVYTAR